ncbi:hypothetical protein QYE76_012894 [Lolium multiflorum]|uniref:Uncharacterized protein n=1 Tax=Lolium multiflorum TaxID=4521 RepID=A0AAD8X6Q0_LOLMU|nr:hypothetical protein QYE76_012894 [Lolium multiflorum]
MASVGGATLYSEQLPPAMLQRRSANYQPKTWDYDSICSMQYANKPSKQISSVEASLKQRVRQLLLKEDQEVATRLRIIGQLQSLGVAYHFEEEITRILMSMHVHDAYLLLKHDLSSTALLFRMLRAHGIPASTEILGAFCDGTGDLEAANPSLDSDGLVALYEASYLAFPGEAMLDRARAFAVKRLQELMPSMKPFQREKIRDVLLDLPLHWRAPRLQTIRSLEEHRGDLYETCRDIIDPSVLQLAVLDFNLVQAVHRSELLEVTRWWKETGLGEKLPFARDRLVECFFCAACIAPEPCLAGCREVLAKVGALIVHLDDVYDLYGTLDELAMFTDAVGAWSSAAAALPEYMKAMYSAIRSTSAAAVDRVMEEQGYDVLPLYKKAWHELCKAFLVEAKWQHERTMPSLDEYLDNGWITSTGPLLLLHAFTMLQHTQQQDSWLRDDDDDGSKDMVYPRLVELCSRVFRLCNDRATHEAESEQGEGPSFIACHMAEGSGGASEEDARGAVADAIAETLKEVNREVAFRNTGAANSLCVNLARIIQGIYRDGDGITSPTDSRKRLVKDLLFTPADLDICDPLGERYTDG